VIIIAALDELLRLRDLSGESALLIVPNGIQRLVVKEVPSLQQITISWKEGNAMPIHIGSSGKLLLSQFDEKERETLLHYVDRQSVSPNTITDPKLLRKEIHKTEKQGDATSFSESHLGSAGISVSIENYICPVALCLFGPAFRFAPEEYLEEMKKSATRISERLANYKTSKNKWKYKPEAQTGFRDKSNNHMISKSCINPETL
jgi:IclR family acetate operon transcriptional repressor